MLVTVLVCVLLGRRLLPERVPAEQLPDLTGHLETVLGHYKLEDGFTRLRVRAGSPFVGEPPTNLPVPRDVTVVGVQHPDGSPGADDEAVHPGDVVVVSGPAGHVMGLVASSGVDVVTTSLTRETKEALLGRDDGVAEVVVPPRSGLVGQPVFPGLDRWDLTILEVRRLGHDRGPRVTELAEGDLMLLHGPWAAVSALARDEDLLLVNDPELVRRQNAPLGGPAWRALAVLGVVVALLATDLTTPAIAGLVGAAGMVLLRVLTPRQAYRGVSWQTIVLIGGLIPLSSAITTSGAAELIASGLVRGVDVLGLAGTRPLLAAIFVLTVLLGQFVSNAATVLVVIPIALAVAADGGVPPATMLVLVAVAGATSFLTPIATPANMIVMGPAGYRFGDYWRLGLVVTLAWFVLAVGLVPVIWS